MSFLEEYGFDKDDIQEFMDNVPKKIIDVMNKHTGLVKENLSFVKNLGIGTFKEIFIHYPDLFLRDASNFSELFSRYKTEELIEKLNANYKMVEYL